MIENLEYNTVRENLIIPEYGRHIQKMINYASSRLTKEERNKLANAIISVMGNLQPHLSYPQNFPKYRFYGNNIKIMIDEAVKWDEGEMKDALIVTIANHMKKCFLNWNKDSVKDQIIFEHLYELSETRIDIRDSKEELLDSSLLLRSKRKFSNKKFPKKNNKNRKRY